MEKNMCSLFIFGVMNATALLFHIFFFDEVKLYSSAMRVCWQPSKRFTSVTQKKKTQEIATKLIKKRKSLKSVQHPLYPPHYTKNRRSSYNAI